MGRRTRTVANSRRQEYQVVGELIEQLVTQAVKEGRTNWREISLELEASISKVSPELKRRFEHGEQLRNLWVAYRKSTGKPAGSIVDYFRMMQEKLGRDGASFKEGYKSPVRVV